MRLTGDRDTALELKQVARMLLVAAAATCVLAAAAPVSALGFGPLSSFGSKGAAAGQMSFSAGLAVGADGTIYVADAGNNRIDVFSATGTFLHAFGKGVNPIDGSDSCTSASGCKQGLQDGSAGAMISPQDVAIGGGLLYVADTNNNRIDVFSTSGTFVFAFGMRVNPTDGSNVCTPASGCVASPIGLGEAGSMRHPSGLAVDPAGLVYVADTIYERIDVFNATGTFLRAYGKGVNHADGTDVCTVVSICLEGMTGDAAGMFNGPVDVTIGPDGQLAVADEENARIDVFSSDGTFLYAFGKKVNVTEGSDVCTALSVCKAGLEDGSVGTLVDPAAIAADGRRVLVAESGSDRVSELGFDGSFIRSFGEGVVDGATAFQVCSLRTGCRLGGRQPIPGAIGDPRGVAVDGRGAIYVSEASRDLTRVELFGEAPPEPPTVSNRFKFGKLKLNRRKGTATLTITIPGPGELLLEGKGIQPADVAAGNAGTVKLPVKPIGRLRRRLARTGKARVRVRVAFTPTGGAALTQAKQVTLRELFPAI